MDKITNDFLNNQYLYTTAEGRKVYQFSATINGVNIKRIVINFTIYFHYLQNHSDYMTEALIYQLTQYLDHGYYKPDKFKDDWRFFTTIIWFDSGKAYKLIFCLQDKQEFLGIIHCYRRSKYDKNKRII